MVKILHRCIGDIVGSSGGTEQAKVVISRATLGLIQVGHTREEASGFQGDGHSSLRKPPNLEADLTHGSGAKVQCTPELQREDFGYSKTHDNLEARMGGVQGPIEKDGMEYGRHSFDEC